MRRAKEDRARVDAEYSDADARRHGRHLRSLEIKESSLFGSVLRDDFRPDSDVDLLIDFQPDAAWSAFELIGLRDELSEQFGRPVDLVERSALKNPFRRHAILTSRRIVHGG